jgi:DNA polymerase
LFIGEAPGQREDELGRPFVGAAGKLLTDLLKSIGLRREDVFITNVVKCRPPNNRDPKDDEVDACSAHTIKIIRLISPRVLVTLGNHAGKFVFETLASQPWKGVKRSRGRIYKLHILENEITIIPTYHPAAALYNPRLRDELEKDFDLIGNVLKSNNRKKELTLLDFMRDNR